MNTSYSFVGGSAFTLCSAHPAHNKGCSWALYCSILCQNHGDAHVAQDARQQIKALVLPRDANAKMVQTMGRTFFALLAKVATNSSCTSLVEPIPPTMQYEYWIDMLKRSGMAGHSVIALLGTQFQTVMNHKMDILVSWTSSNYHNASALHMDVSTLPPPLKVQKLQHQNQLGARDKHGGSPM